MTDDSFGERGPQPLPIPGDLHKFADMLAIHQASDALYNRDTDEGRIVCLGCNVEIVIPAITQRKNLGSFNEALRRAFAQHQADMIAPLI